MDAYSRGRESRRRTQSVAFLVMYLGLTLGLFRSAGLVVVIVVWVVPLALIWSVGRLLQHRDRTRERRRRQLGQPPSWPARMPAIDLAAFGGEGRHAVSSNIEHLGRLSLLDEVWRWTPGKAGARNLHLKPAEWDRRYFTGVRRIWGPWNQGIVEFKPPESSPFLLWISDPADLYRTVNGPAPQHQGSS